MGKTTVMRDSNVGDEWIAEMCRLNPVQHCFDEKGQPNGNILTGPVRLTFCDALFEPKPKMKSDPNSRVGFGTTVLFTPYTDFSLFWQEYYRIAGSDFASHYDTASQQYYGLDNPFVDQGTKMKFGGYTPGLLFTNLNSSFKPLVCTPPNYAPVVDQSKVYPGVWAICAVNTYASGKGMPKKGPRFGLVQVILIGDDTPLAGGAPDPKNVFKNVSVRPPAAVPMGAFGAPPAGAPGVPPQSPGVGAFYGQSPARAPAAPPVGGFAPPPAAPVEDDMSEFM